jgi:signal transduction histidine kinase
MNIRFDSITLRLFKRVLVYYALIACLVAAGQAVYEHHRLSQQVRAEIDQTARLFVPTLGTAVWNLDQQLALAAAIGIAQSPYVLHVVVEDLRGAMRLAIAHDPDTGTLLPSQSEVMKAPDTHSFAFKLSSPDIDSLEPLGSLTVYLNEEALTKNSIGATLLIILNTGLMALVLVIVLMFFGTTFLGRPIRQLTEGVRGLTLENLGRERLAVDTADNEELKILQNSFNDLAIRLADSIEAAQSAQRLSEKLSLEQALESRTRQLLEKILDSSPLATFVIDADHCITHWNRACEMTLGFSSGEMLGTQSAWRAFYDEERPVLADLVIDAGRSGHGEISGPYASQYRPSPFIEGGYETAAFIERLQRWIYCTVAPIRGVDGQIIGAIETLQDITERQNAEASIRASLAQQQELNELKSRFVSMTSHEFRTPLATILSSAELLRHYAERLPENERQTLLASIETAVRRMTDMLDSILIIGRADAGRVEFQPAPLAVDAFCQLAVSEAVALVKSREYEESRRAIPEIRIDCQFAGEACLDEKLLRHILSNLLSNAIKYSPEGGLVTLAVRQPEADEAAIVFQITDQGIGIPADDMPHLFDTFHRGTNVGNIAGTGLGMAIVQRAVNLHRGRIDVHSEPGAGTTFVVTLPSDALERDS